MAVPADAALKSLYYVMQSIEAKLGGGEGIEGMYGSIKRLGMHKVIEALAEHCNLSSKSHFLDVGAGIGRPLLHALLTPGVASSHGIELDRIKVDKADAFFKRTASDLQQRSITLSGLPTIQCSSIEEVDTLDPATHAYSFWEGVPPSGKEAFGRLFHESSTLQAVAVVQRAMRVDNPCTLMGQMGFGPLALVARFPVSMSGSGRNFTAYTFRRRVIGPSRGLAAAPPTPGTTQSSGSPAATAQGTSRHSGELVVTLHLQVDATTAAQVPKGPRSPRVPVRQGLGLQCSLLSPMQLGTRGRHKAGLAPQTPAQGSEKLAASPSGPQPHSTARPTAPILGSRRLRVGPLPAGSRQPLSDAGQLRAAPSTTERPSSGKGQTLPGAGAGAAASRAAGTGPRRSMRQQVLAAQPQRKRQ